MLAAGQIVFVAALAAVVAGAFVALVRIVCAADKRLLLAETRGMLCDAPDGRGISVLCSGVAGVEEVRRLLDEGYPRYEAVVVLDSVRRPEAFAAVLAEFHLIDVNYDPADDLPAEGVRGLYRSRKRCYRRLVVVDKAFTSCRADFDAAVGVAIYDYVLPLRPGIRMMPFCIGRLAIELSLEPAGAVELVRSPVGEPLLLVAREAAVAAGGFGPDLVRSIPRSRRRTLYEPFLRAAKPSVRRPVLRRGAALLLAACIAATAAAGWWEVCAVLLTLAVVAAAAEYARTCAPEARTARAASRKSV